MKTNFVDQYCREHFGEQSLYAYILHSSSPANVVHGITVLMREYARECCKASLEKAADNAEAEYLREETSIVVSVLEESITNPENITLL